MAVGSRGDVAPFTGLAQRLRNEGHEVVIATHRLFEEMVSSSGSEFAPLPMDTNEELNARLARGGVSSPVKVVQAFNRMLVENAPEAAEAMQTALKSADVAMLTPGAWIGAHIAEALSVASVGAYLQPMSPTREFPPPTLGTRSLGGWANYRSAEMLRSLGQRPYRGFIRELRQSLGLPPITTRRWFAELERQRWPICHGFSPHVVPQPADWPPWHRPVGYWWPATDSAYTPDARLADFISAGERPIYVGFGSMPSSDGRALSQMVAAAVKESGVRAVVHAGWAELELTGDNVLTVSDVPHDWLFPQMAAVVHHAGAGTTAAGLRAGVPTLAVPHMMDQPFWAQRIHRLGAGPEPIPFRRLSASRLSDGLREVRANPAYRTAARRLSDLLACEDGARGVLETLEAL